ncbi:Gst Glutathione S-transferase [Rhabdaerophilaceae bacterium]
MDAPTRPRQEREFADLTAWLWATPNSNRVSILFEELELPYRVIGVNIRRREQFEPDILAMNPYGKIPIVAWSEGGDRHVMFESGAILIAFAERFGRFLPASGASRSECLAWLMVGLTGLGPMTGQAHHWTDLAPEKSDVAVQHTVSAVKRIYTVLDGRLAQGMFLAGDYSIADIAAYPWVHRHSWATIAMEPYPHVARWLADVGARPAVQRGMALPAGAKLEG